MSGEIVRALVESGPAFGASTPAQTAISTVAALALAANPKRKGFIIQNTGTTVIKLSLGTTDPTQTVYHVALAACTIADDGKGAAYIETAWVGQVRIISSGSGGTCVITELTTGRADWNQASDFGL